MAFKHGANGYRRHGCRCEVCKDDHAAERRRERAKLNGGPGLAVVRAPFPAFPAEPEPVVERGPVGSTAETVEAEIEELASRANVWTKECDRLQSQAMAAAKIVDDLIANGRVHLVPPHYRLISQAMAELKAILLPVRMAGTRTAEDEVQAAQAEIDDWFGGPFGTPNPESRRDHLPHTVTAESFKKEGEAREDHTHTRFCAKPCYRGEDYLGPNPGFKTTTGIYKLGE